MAKNGWVVKEKDDWRSLAVLKSGEVLFIECSLCLTS